MSEQKDPALFLTLGVINRIVADKKYYDGIAVFLGKTFLPSILQDAYIRARVKSLDGIAGKILTKYIGLNDEEMILNEFTDLVGVRVIFLRRDLVDKADRIIRSNFVVDDAKSQDVADRLNEREFGYLSKHYIVRINRKWLDSKHAGIDIEPDKTICVEIQVRTWLQHVWAELSHDSIYKGDREIPKGLLRSWNAIAAILENTDNDIMDCLDELERNQKNKAYFIAEEIERRIRRLRIIAEVQSKNSEYVKKSSLEKTVRELNRLCDLLSENEELKNNNMDFCKKIARKKRFSISSNNQKSDDEFQSDPTNPRNLLRYLREKIEGGEIDLENNILLDHLLHSAIRRCDDMIKTSSELPWAFAGKSLFLLLLLSPNDEPKALEKSIDSIFEAILRLLDLCNVRSVANLGSKRFVATKDSREALEELYSFVSSMESCEKALKYKEIDCNGIGSAPLLGCLEKLLSLGKYAHLETPSEQISDIPSVIIAGGCNTLQGEELNDFKELFSAVLRKGKSKIEFYTGAGHVGICSLAPKRQSKKQKRYKWHLFGVASDDDRQNVEMYYDKHSIFEALLEWEALKENHKRFDDVALVGFGLGKISSLECRIALALGARVTVIGHKKYADDLRNFKNSPYWSSHPSLVHLPLIRNTAPQNKSINGKKAVNSKKWKDLGFPEPVMLRVFMLFQPYHEADYKCDESIPSDYSLTLLIHRINTLKTKVAPHDLEDLEEHKQLSEQHRLLSFEKLWDDVPQKQDLPDEVSIPSYDPKAFRRKKDALVEFLKNIPQPPINKKTLYAFGEREHARWYVERWLQGTRYGDNKIDKNVPGSKKRNPCMVAWYDLDDDTILKDTGFLNRYAIAKSIMKKHNALMKAINHRFSKKASK